MNDQPNMQPVLSRAKPIICGMVAFWFALSLFPPLRAQTVGSNQIMLLIPDTIASTDPGVTVWADAAIELGIQLLMVRDSEFLKFSHRKRLQYAGLILPDTIHQIMSDSLVAAVKEYVALGGNLLLLYDAGIKNQDNKYYIDPQGVTRSRFSELLGIQYQLYLLNDKGEPYFTVLSKILGRKSVFPDQQIPPGKHMDYIAPAQSEDYYLAASDTDPTGLAHYQHWKQMMPPEKGPWNRQSPSDWGPSVGKSSTLFQQPRRIESTLQDPLQAVNGYLYGPLNYPIFVTQGTFDGKTLLTAANTNSLAAGSRSFGKGWVLFVNLPLSYLKRQTDGILMQGMLCFYAVQNLKVPLLSPQPMGIGGMVFNWHIDAAVALIPMSVLKDNGIWDRGPFSIDFTAGPDQRVIGDGLGLNVPQNPISQNWIRYFIQKGHPVGSHGGWIHDYYGINASEANQEDFQPFLELNKQAIETTAGSGYKIPEYSAPVGNTPSWSVTWAENIGITGYYFVGCSGMAPTRVYRPRYCGPGCFSVGERLNDNIWALPVSSYGDLSTFEEFNLKQTPKSDILQWLKDLVDFAHTYRTTRLFYSHPPGVAVSASNIEIIGRVLDYADTYIAQNAFKWYTIPEIGQFQSSRLRVSWSMKQNLANNSCVFDIVHPVALKGFTWILSKDAFDRPVVQTGTIQISEDSLTKQWILVVTQGKTETKGESAQFSAQRISTR